MLTQLWGHSKVDLDADKEESGHTDTAMNASLSTFLCLFFPTLAMSGIHCRLAFGRTDTSFAESPGLDNALVAH